VISGSSAGSLITAMMGTRTDDELLHLINKGDFRKDFISFAWNKKLNNEKVKEKRVLFQYFVPQSFRWLSDTLLNALFEKEIFLKPDTNHLRELIVENVGLYTFQEAFDRTGRIINITVAPLNSYDPPRLMNYLTTPHVTVWSATAASCAIPGVFDSVALTVKEPNGDFTEEHEWTRLGPNSPFKHPASINYLEDNENNFNSSTHKYSDGSVENDLPMQQLSELFNVNHFIVSQVNPHSFLLSSLSLHSTIWSSPVFRLASGYLRFLKHQSRNWLRNVIDLLMYRTVAPSWAGRRGFTQLLTQEYEGRNTDVSIMPWKGHISVFQAFLNLLRNPSDEEFFEIVEVGEKSVWPQLSRIKAHCAVELTLDRCVQRLKLKLAKEIELCEAGIYNEAGPDPSSSSKRKKKIIDRTPSFFTCHSNVNLSKLVPIDPIDCTIDPIIITQKENNSPLFNIERNEKEENIDVGFNINNFEESNIKQRKEENKSVIIDENVTTINPTLSINSPEKKLERSRSMADFYYQRSLNNDSSYSPS
jgi:TAG lipase/steryl ester hydrolase/phospholipase A2/LPA acyltransferase